MILAAGDLLIFLAMTFVGDHLLGGVIPSFMIVWLVLMVYRLATGLELNSKEMKLQLILMALFMPYMIYGAYQLDNYYYAFIQIVLYINTFPVLRRFILNRRAMPVIFVLYLLLTAFALMFGGGNRWESNSTFLFGPNIMYRIYGLLFFAFFYTISNEEKSKGILLLSVFAMSIICMISTGSRGAFIILLAEIIMIMIYFREHKYFRYLSYLVFCIIIYYIIQYWELIEPILGRLIYFDANNASEGARIMMYFDFYRYLQTEPILTLLFGIGNNNSYYPILYPHNLIVEMVVYHGLVFFSFLAIASTALYKKFSSSEEIKAFVMVFFPIMLGSMISGYFLDNFTIISLIFYCYLSQNSENSQKPSNKNKLSYS